VSLPGLKDIEKCLVSRGAQIQTNQKKTANRSKKIENSKKPNIFGYVWMSFFENRWIGSQIDFSRPNQTEQNRIHIF
jgi:hypothetical protein